MKDAVLGDVATAEASFAASIFSSGWQNGGSVMIERCLNVSYMLKSMWLRRIRSVEATWEAT